MHYYSMMVNNNLLPIQHNTMLFLSPFSTVVLLSYNISVRLTHCCQASIPSDRPENETNYTYVQHPTPTFQKLGKKNYCFFVGLFVVVVFFC